MTNVDLLSIVQPPDGWFALLCIRGDDVRQELVATREELDTRTQEYVQNKWNVYFGVAKFETNKNRLKDNVKALKAFWLDIDCGEDKAEINPKTGRPDGYIDQATGMQELQRFCKWICDLC